MYKSQNDSANEISQLKAYRVEDKKNFDKLQEGFIQFQIQTNAKFSTIDNIKEGIDRLNRLQEKSR